MEFQTSSTSEVHLKKENKIFTKRGKLHIIWQNLLLKINKIALLCKSIWNVWNEEFSNLKQPRGGEIYNILNTQISSWSKVSMPGLRWRNINQTNGFKMNKNPASAHKNEESTILKIPHSKSLIFSSKGWWQQSKYARCELGIENRPHNPMGIHDFLPSKRLVQKFIH